MTMQFDGFNWDRGNTAKCQTHRLSAATIEGLFTRPLAIIPNEAHSHKERRFRGARRFLGIVAAASCVNEIVPHLQMPFPFPPRAIVGQASSPGKRAWELTKSVLGTVLKAYNKFENNS